jgi:hypothetical protein
MNADSSFIPGLAGSTRDWLEGASSFSLDLVLRILRMTLSLFLSDRGIDAVPTDQIDGCQNRRF